jgi:ABC-type multidrug transport system fused ATPase/permease subunit
MFLQSYSALDTESELVVQEALDNILQNKDTTTIIIAHRLSTIRNADVINVVVGGRIQEQGTHDELMAKESYYRRLVEKQEGKRGDEARSSAAPSRSSSGADLSAMDSDANKATSLSSTVAHIEFKNVAFSYPTRPKKTIFFDFNLAIEQGETVALVGPSGEGKSTTVGLIERFYDPTAGEVRYLGEDVRSLNVGWYRSQLSYVGQEPVLFDMTIAENIAFGLQEVTRAEIEEAARKVCEACIPLDLRR